MQGRADPEAATISSESLEEAARPPSLPEEGPPLLAGRYELLGMLGRGAMGVVYRARDRELDEIVALKFLMKELASPAMLERFRREVKLARRVTHRNVARTFDIGEHGGDRFLTMELVEGEMLSSLLERRRRLPMAEAIRLAIDVCAGLSAAHAANVLHRDLKPDNIIVAKDGHAVIADFGIARAASEGDFARTGGGIVGTPAYMAPEQVEGSSDLDARADLYALGTMLYELLTGELAWKGTSVVTIAAGRLLRPPPDPRATLPTLPDPLAELVLKLMARRREDRFASADDLRAALERLDVPTSTLSPALPRARLAAELGPRLKAPSGARVVVVLPVLNLGTEDDRYLVDNIDEDVVDLLSVVPNLLVRPRGETARFSQGARDVRDIGRSLGADVVVDASLRRIGGNVRVSFRLITVQDGFQLWARRYERAPTDVLSLTDEAVRAIASALTTELTVAAPRSRPTNPEAEELYLRGRYLLRRGWHEVVREAADVLKRAHAIAPDDPRIMGTYALSLSRAYGLADTGPELAAEARSLATAAMARDPSAAEAKVALGMLHLQEQDGVPAIGHLCAALAIAPNCADALDWLGRVLGEVGRLDEAIALLGKVGLVDPEAVHGRLMIGRLHALSGDHEAMVASLGDVPTHRGDAASWFALQARAIMWRRDAAEADKLELLSRTRELPQSARFAVDNCLAMARGKIPPLEQLDLLDQLLPIASSRTRRRASFNAQLRTELFAVAGMADRAVAALSDGNGVGLFDIVWLSRCALFDALRDRPDFKALEDKVRRRADGIAAAFDKHASRTGF